MWGCFSAVVTFLADLSAVLTAVVAVWLWVRVVWAARKRRKALEDYLRAEKFNDGDKGLRTVLHLMSQLAMTEAEIYAAAFSSKVVKAVPVSEGDTKTAKRIMFQYTRPTTKPNFLERLRSRFR